MSEVGTSNLISVAEAITILDAQTVSPRVERVDLLHADGRLLATPVLVDRDAPPFDKALMDGYAVRAADVDPEKTLRRVGEIAAGGTGVAIGVGECTAIMTGAPLPPGADAVVPIEWTTIDGDAVRVDRTIAAGHAVAKRGIEAKSGEVALPAGVRLGPAQLAVCAQVGAVAVDVFGRPRVGVLSSGDEVVAFDRTPADAQIRNSNTPLLVSLARRLGCDAVDLGHVGDDPAAIATKLATPGLDAVLVTGGMSMGTYDYTPRVLQGLGYELAITKLKIKPGKPFVFARKPRAADGAAAPFIFGLPGNPVSAFVCTVRLAARVLQRLGGQSPEPDWLTAKIGHPMPPNGPREFYQPAVVRDDVARVPAWNGSADLFSLASANALLVRMANEPKLSAEQPVMLIRLP